MSLERVKLGTEARGVVGEAGFEFEVADCLEDLKEGGGMALRSSATFWRFGGGGGIDILSSTSFVTSGSIAFESSC